MAHTYRLNRSQTVALPRDEVFAFFADPKNLERLTPDFLAFRVDRQSQPEMGDGLLIDYRLKLYGVPLRWQSRIDEYRPPHQFIDEQTRGPYRRWRHLHRFEETAEGTRIVDRVDYELPLGPLGRLAHALFVRRSLARIFDFRVAAIEEIFSPTTDSVGQSALGNT